MAIALLVSNPAEADRVIAIGLDLAARLKEPLAILCLEADPIESKKSVDSDSDKRKSKLEKSKLEKSNDKNAEKTTPTDNPHIPKAFKIGSSYTNAAQELATKHLATMKFGFVVHDVIEIPSSIDEIRQWLMGSHQSPMLGKFSVDTFVIPMLRGAGLEGTTPEKNRLFEIAQCETICISVCVELTENGRLPLSNIGIMGSTNADLLNASRFARRMTESKVTSGMSQERPEDQECVLLGIAGKASKTRIDGNINWKKIRKDMTLPVAILLNPADSRRERWLTAVEDKVHWWFRSYQMNREKRVELSSKLMAGAESSPEFILFMSVATFLACIGLIQDSAAVIIGAMLVAPLMTPLLGAGMSMILGNRPLFFCAVRTIVLGVAIAFLIGTIVGLFSLMVPSYMMSGSSLVLTNEMISRSQPNLLDPFVGLAAGFAGGFAIGRDGQIGTVAGVAIAAALVPPIATAGLEAALILYSCLGQGDLGMILDMLRRDPGTLLEANDLITTSHKTTTNVHLVFAPLVLFFLNAVATIIGAYSGLRLVGMHRTNRPRSSRRWVAVVFLALILSVIFFVMVLPFLTEG